MTKEEHTHDIVRVEEGETVILEMRDGNHIRATCTGQNVHNDKSGVHIIEQKTTTFERVSDGEELVATITDGLRGNEEAPEFPWYSRLAVLSQIPNGPDEEAPDGTYLGYVAEVRSV